MTTSPEQESVTRLETLVGHAFGDRSLAEMALTHPSTEGEAHYQRLEFLGDRVLGLAIARWLYDTFPSEPEGHLNRRLAALVRRERLAQIAGEIGLGPLVRMAGPSAGGEAEGLTTAVLADVCEAVIGAMYLDGGLGPVERFIRRHWKQALEAGPSAYRDAKTALQEWAQARGHGLPTYRQLGRTGPDHAPRFEIEAVIDGAGTATGTGATKRAAEQAAAARLLEDLDASQGGNAS